MRPGHAGVLLAATLLGAGGWRPATAALVTVGARDKSGAAVEDVVVVFDPLDASAPPSPRGAAVIDQINKRYVPRVTVVRAGSEVAFPNSDQIRHQVYSFSPAKTFNLKLYAGSPRMKVTFEKTGLVVLGCNIHDSMVAYVAVVDTPYFVRTAPGGGGALDLPQGHYRVRVWHPNLTGPADAQTIAVETSPLSLPLTLALDPSHDGTHSWTE